MFSRHINNIAIRGRLGAWRVAAAIVIMAQLASGATPSPDQSTYEIGVAKIDITPEYPVRLSGFSFRREESAGVRQRIWAKAMAIGVGDEAVVLVTVDSIGIPRYLSDEVAKRLQQAKGLPRERLAICATHSHTTPSLSDTEPTGFGAPIPPEHQVHIDRYTRELTDKIEHVALEALEDRRPGQMSLAFGKVGFAINRRTRGGPVDHDLPLLRVSDADGKLRALYVSYACHCVVLSDYKVSGDWAGCAAEQIERNHPGAVAMVAIGCGADSNPASGVTGDRGEVAEQYGMEVAAEVDRLLTGSFRAVQGKPRCAMETIQLPLAALPTREEWIERSKREGDEGYYAQFQLDRLGRGERLPTEIPYQIQTWKFGDSLAMVFLSGEVVVDYSLRWKRELDADRLWINAYANDCPAYIPSERVLKEGGYEAGGANVFYGWPAWFAPGLEDKINSTVRAQLGTSFEVVNDARGTQGIAPKSPQESLATIQVDDGLQVELVASEPMISSPVAIDFGPDGRIWVVEMHDYNNTKDGSPGEPGGRIVVLEDRDGNGSYECSTVFLDELSCPFGVTVWRKGVLICAAPDILYAEDTTGDGKADVVKKLYSGFGIQHPDARVNGLTYGLDGWVYGANTFAGTIHSYVQNKDIQLGDRDFRIKPDSGELEPETGRTQQGRARDDWGNWFGCHNLTLCFHYPLSNRYLGRNPQVALLSSAVSVADANAARLFPRGSLVLFPLSGPAGTPTAACSVTLYRDELLGSKYAGSVFTCEPVHQLIHRMVLEPSGATFVGHRPNNEVQSEFLTSTDNWFRPVQIRTGPDGALWVVDMYRYVVEHPLWIPESTLATLDVTAGSSMGRIYRVVRRDGKRRQPQNLDAMDTQELVAALDTPNGTQRDLVQQLLVWRDDNAAVEPLLHLTSTSKRASTRLQSLSTLDSLGELPNEQIEMALKDPHPGVRRQAIRLAEARLDDSSRLANSVLSLVDDSDPQVALQLACSLEQFSNPQSVVALAHIARRHSEDDFIVTAVLTSISPEDVGSLLRDALAMPGAPTSDLLVEKLMDVAGAMGPRDAVATAFDIALGGLGARQGTPHYPALAALLGGLRRNEQSWDELVSPETRRRLEALTNECIGTATDDSAELGDRIACLRVLSRVPILSLEQVESLASLVSAEQEPRLQSAALDCLAMHDNADVAKHILHQWPGLTPQVRNRVLDILLSRDSWTRQLIADIKDRSFDASQIDAAHRQQLTEHPNQEIRKLAAEYLSQYSSPQRAEVVARYAMTRYTTGDSERGRAVFDKNCASCHKFKDTGHAVGPDLASLVNKSDDSLVESVLDPNRAVDQRYAEYLAITHEGRTFKGILTEETATSITLKGQQGEQITLLRSEVDTLESGRSMMPEGFENEISLQQMADLFTFLSSQPQSPASTLPDASVSKSKGE